MEVENTSVNNSPDNGVTESPTKGVGESPAQGVSESPAKSVSENQDTDITVTNVSEGSSDFVRIKQEVDLPEDDTYYPMDFGISVEDDEETNPVYVKMKNKEGASSEHPRPKGRGKSIGGRKSLRARAMKRQEPQPVTYVGSSDDDGDDLYSETLKGYHKAEGNEIKNRTFRTDLTNEEEEKMVEWLQRTECLYNRHEMNYRDQHIKHKIWADQAKQMGKKVIVLKVWYRSIRTRYVRLCKKASRFGIKSLTARDRWIVKKLSFLAEHIVKGKITKGMNALPEGSGTVLLHPDDDDGSGLTSTVNSTLIDYYREIPSPPPPPAAGRPSSPGLSPGSAPGPSSKGIKSAPAGDSAAIVLGLTQRSEQFIQMQERVLLSMLQPKPITERTTFADWMKAVIEGFDQSVWRDFQQECSQLIHKYQCRNDQLLSAQHTPPSTSKETATREQPADRNQYSQPQPSSDTVTPATNAFPGANLQSVVTSGTNSFPRAPQQLSQTTNAFPRAPVQATNAFQGAAIQVGQATNAFPLGPLHSAVAQANNAYLGHYSQMQ